MTNELLSDHLAAPLTREIYLTHCNRGKDVWRNKEFTAFLLDIRQAIKDTWQSTASDLKMISGAKSSTVSFWKNKSPEGYSKAGQLACICYCLNCDPREIRLPPDTCIAVRSYYRTYFQWEPSGKSVVSTLTRSRANARVHDIFEAILDLSTADQTWVKQHHGGLDLLFAGMAHDNSGSEQVVHDLQRALIVPSDWPVGRNTISTTLNCRKLLRDCFCRWNKTPRKKRRYRNYIAAGEGIRSELYLTLRGHNSDLACVSLRFKDALPQKALRDIGQNMLEQLQSTDTADLLEVAQRDQLDYFLDHIGFVTEKYFPTRFGVLKNTLRYITDISMVHMPPARQVDLISCLQTQVARNLWPNGKVIIAPHLLDSIGHSNVTRNQSNQGRHKSRRPSCVLAYPDSFAQFLGEALLFMACYGDVQVDCAPMSGTAFIHLQIANVHTNPFTFHKDGFDAHGTHQDIRRRFVVEELARDMPTSPWGAICEIAGVMAEISCGHAVANSAAVDGPYAMRFLLPCCSLLKEF